jgi:hypothetical protein
MPKYRGCLGFHDLELFNLALLARKVWMILNEPVTLSARVLKTVYYTYECILNVEVGTNPS